MLKSEKINIFNKSIKEKIFVGIDFIFSDRRLYFYVLDYNDKYVLLRQEDDFSLDGYFVTKISYIKKISCEHFKINEINKKLGLADKIVNPGVDISSWSSLLKSLLKDDKCVMVENENRGCCLVGHIDVIEKNYATFKCFDIEGKMIDDKELSTYKYSDITTIEWDYRYTDTWDKYIKGKI